MQTIPQNFLGRMVYKLPREALSTAISDKVRKLQEKVKVREGRIENIRTTNGITDAILVDLLQQARTHSGAQFYTVTGPSNLHIPGSVGNAQSGEVTVSAGVIASLTTEGDAKRDEEEAIERLERIRRNIAWATEPCELNYSELEFLGL